MRLLLRVTSHLLGLFVRRCTSFWTQVKMSKFRCQCGWIARGQAMFDGVSISTPLATLSPYSAPPTRQSRNRLSRPESGRSLGGSVTAAERPVRQAISQLGRAVAIDKSIEVQLFGCTVYGPGASPETFDTRLAWFVVASTLLHAWRLGNQTTSTFAQALEWFTGDALIARSTLSCYPRQQLKAAERALNELEITEDFWDLLPYILEPHGHITRSEFETCDVAQKTRSTKKKTGVYYTPSDVADFMISSVARSATLNGNWFDPACGTGVFFRSIVRHHLAQHSDNPAEALTFVQSKLFAIDKSALATDLASFVLLAECGDVTHPDSTPFGEWMRIKGNMVCMDALRLVPPDCTPDLHARAKDCMTILEAFPAVIAGVFDHVVMNPPYANVQVDQHLKATWHSYRGLALGSSADTHLGFTEMLWRLTAAQSGAIAVLPVSVGTNTTKSYQRLREVLLASPGLKDFLFFDREPQALFGEDIKTRNVVVIRQSGPGIEDSVRTSRMLKWTGQQRAAIFTRDRAVPIHVNSCKAFVPKVGSVKECLIYEALQSTVTLLAAARHRPIFMRVLLDNARSNCPSRDTILVSSTAYNFVNCFLTDGLPVDTPKPYSSSPINALIFTNESLANAAFAVLSSRLCFWLWHVEGDGFHLTSDFLQRLPLWAALQRSEVRSRLARLGRELWTEAQENVVGSVNGGKQTYSFHAGHKHPITLEIDSLLIDALGLSPEASSSLEDFVQSTVSIDGKPRARGFSTETMKLI